MILPAPRQAIFGRRLFVVGLLLIAAARRAAAGPNEAALADAVRVLGREKSAAESYAEVLATVGKDDGAHYAQGILLYAQAKAEFDGLIAELKFELEAGNDPDASAKFAEALRGAAEKRVAFTKFVDDAVIGKSGGTKAGLPDVIEAVPELVKALSDAGLSIWRAYHEGDEDRRKAMLSALRQLQWRSFGEIAKS